jgi:thioredoxin-related protein
LLKKLHVLAIRGSINKKVSKNIKKVQNEVSDTFSNLRLSIPCNIPFLVDENKKHLTISKYLILVYDTTRCSHIYKFCYLIAKTIAPEKISPKGNRDIGIGPKV